VANYHLLSKRLAVIQVTAARDARRMPAGARLRLTIAPLNSPNFQKNYNTGGQEDARVAHIEIFHDAEHASQLILPLAASVSPSIGQ
jgi:predicted acyl esterase